MIAAGLKPIENRNWRTAFRGRFWIHAAKGMSQQEYDDAREFAEEIFWRTGVQAMLPKPAELLRGGIIGKALMTDCVSSHPSPWFAGEYGFVIANAKPVEFRPCKGALGFFRPVYPADLFAKSTH